MLLEFESWNIVKPLPRDKPVLSYLKFKSYNTIEPFPRDQPVLCYLNWNLETSTNHFRVTSQFQVRYLKFKSYQHRTVSKWRASSRLLETKILKSPRIWPARSKLLESESWNIIKPFPSDVIIALKLIEDSAIIDSIISGNSSIIHNGFKSQICCTIWLLTEMRHYH